MHNMHIMHIPVLSRKVKRPMVNHSPAGSGLQVSEGNGDGSPSGAVDEEEVDRKSGNLAIFKAYFRAGGSWCILAFYALVLVLAQVATSGTDLWLSYWTNLEDFRARSANRTGNGNGTGTDADEPSPESTEPSRQANASSSFPDGLLQDGILRVDENGLLTTNSAIYVYAGILVICTILCLLRNYLVIRICMRASRKLHRVMFSNLLHSQMAFFHKNPSGEIF